VQTDEVTRLSVGAVGRPVLATGDENRQIVDVLTQPQASGKTGVYCQSGSLRLALAVAHDWAHDTPADQLLSRRSCVDNDPMMMGVSQNCMPVPGYPYSKKFKQTAKPA